MLIETFDLLRPALTIIDAVVAMQGDGPIRGQPRPIGVLLGSQSGLALEHVCCALVAFPPADLPVLRAAREAQLTPAGLDDVEIIGEPLESAKLTDFVRARPSRIGFSLPRLVKSTIKQAWILHHERSQVA